MNTRTQLRVGFSILGILVAAVVMAWYFGLFGKVDDNLHRRYRVEGASMEPALCDGDVLAFRRYDGHLERYQIIVFHMPIDQSRTSLKRVIGLPNETLTIHDETIFIDGSPLMGDSYAKATPNYNMEAITVPADHYFVLGDNRRNSFDSHAWVSFVAPEDRSRLSTVGGDEIIGELPAGTKKC